MDYELARGTTLELTGPVTRRDPDTAVETPIPYADIFRVWMTVKRKRSDPDADALISKGYNVNNRDGILVDVDTGNVTVIIAPADTQDLDAPARLPYDIQVETADGKIHQSQDGKIRLKPETTDA